MRLFFTFVAVVLAAIAGADLSPHSLFGAIFSGLAAYLLLTVLGLRRRINRLEQQVIELRNSPQAEPQKETPLQHPSPAVPEASSQPVFRPKPLSPPKVLPRPAGEKSGRTLLAPLLNIITRGNPVLKIGLVVLFFGVGFLLKYAAQQDLLPLELRLAGVAFAGLILLILGWRLQKKHRIYGHGLEGGGIGILYLVVFAAARYYTFMPTGLALAIMTGLVAASGLLALLQDSKGMAVFASLGGFLAPVLMAGDTGSHVQLFGYYLLLNCGILAIAWYKAWRELNLIGLFFTFGLFALWSATSYTPAFFATTEPFLVAFFLMYAGIAILFALRQPLQLRGFIDGPLVFGLPIVFSSLQAYLVQDFRYGLAFSALGLGGWYVILARILWNKMSEGMRMLTESFLALGIVFVSLAIPLGLDPKWTTASWALEGAAMIWVGVRQQRFAARIFGLILQVGAFLAFLDQPSLGPESFVFANRIFLGAALIALAALFSAYWFSRLEAQARRWEKQLPLLLLAWGCIWWYCGAIVDLKQHAHQVEPEPLFLLYSTLTTALVARLCRSLQWPLLQTALLLHLPMLLLVLFAQISIQTPLLAGWSTLAWPLAFLLQYRMLKEFEQHFAPIIQVLSHCLGYWALLLLVGSECAMRTYQTINLTAAWSMAAMASAPVIILYLVEFKGKHINWPLQHHTLTYSGLGADIPLVALYLWILGSFGLSGDPAPLSYLPLLNPLDLVTFSILLLALIRQLRGSTRWPVKGQRLLPALTAFFWLSVVTGRTVHCFTPTPYSFSALFASSIFQAAIAALWSLLALTLTVLGARKELRKLWLTGASLLALVVGKLFIIDLSGTGSIGRIISFLVVGGLMLVIGYFAPLPPKPSEEASHEA